MIKVTFILGDTQYHMENIGDSRLEGIVRKFLVRTALQGDYEVRAMDTGVLIDPRQRITRDSSFKLVKVS